MSLNDIATLRQIYKIPKHHKPWHRPNGDVVFSYCDQDIIIPADGSAPWRSWMGLNADATSHEFKKELWEPK